MKKTFLLLLLAIIWTTPAFAARNITLPFELKFDEGDTWTSDLAYKGAGGSCGDTLCSITHQNSNGWSGGTSKIVPPQNACCDGINGCMCALGSFQGFSTSRLNIRFLFKLGSSYYSNYVNAGGGLYNKFIDVHGGDTRFGILGLVGTESPDSCFFGLYTDSCYYWNSTACWTGTPSFKFDGTQNSNEWVSVEYEINSNGSSKIYTYKSDGTYVTWTSPETAPSGSMDRIEIGGFYNPVFTVDANTYMLIDELKISNTYIGPPTGFVGGSTPVQTVSGCSIVGGSINP